MINIHLIVPTTTHFEFANRLRHLESRNLCITQSHLDTGPASIESEYDELFAGPGIIGNAIRAQNEGADAIVIVCMGDPALHQAREAVTIPVLGLGETAMHYAAMLGHKFSILPTLDRRRMAYENKAKLYGLESKLASVRPTNIPVLEIEANGGKTFDRLVECAAAAVTDDGADTIILGCGCFQDMDRLLERTLAARGFDVPVIDAPALTVLTAATLVMTGLRHSKHAYPFPPVKAMAGFAVPPLR